MSTTIKKSDAVDMFQSRPEPLEVFYKSRYAKSVPTSTKPTGKTVVVRAGYIDKNTQLAELMDAGIRLEEYRKQMYYNGSYADDGEPNADEDFVDPTSRHDFDEFEANELASRLNKYKAYAKSKRDAQKGVVKGENVSPPPQSSAPAVTPEPDKKT